MSPTPQQILASGGPSDSEPIKDYVGATFTIVSWVPANGKNGSFVVMDVVTSDGEEKKVRTGAQSVLNKLELLGEEGLPIEVTVTSYKTKFSNDGYDITNPDE
jgi:hypothetical protein